VSPIRWSDVAETALGVVLGLAIGAAVLVGVAAFIWKRWWL
jgi:hypothetical protein